MAGSLFLAGVSNNLLVPLSATPNTLNWGCFTVTADTMHEATTLSVRYNFTAEHWSTQITSAVSCPVAFVREDTLMHLPLYTF